MTDLQSSHVPCLPETVKFCQRSVCVVCGAQDGTDLSYKQAAYDVGRLLALHGAKLIYGGARVGLMGAVATGAYAHGGEILGIMPTHLSSVEPTDVRGELLLVPDMHNRKRSMLDYSDAIFVLPGGAGTLDETFEYVTWRRLGLHNKPIILVNILGYWNPLIQMLSHIERCGFAHRGDSALVTIVDRADDLIPVMEAEISRF